MNIVILSSFDYAGSGYKIALAIERANPEMNVNMFVGNKPRPLGHRSGTVLKEENRSSIRDAIRKADIIHYKGDDLPTSEWFGIPIAKRKPKVITLGGSGFRQHGGRLTSLKWHPIEDYIKVTDIRTTLTPDLNYPELNGIYVPQPIDSLGVKVNYLVGVCPYCRSKAPFVVSHSPSTRIKKGTNTAILPAIDRMKRVGKEVVLDIIEQTTYNDCLERKKRSTVFIDNVYPDVGAYGNSALEAMQYGIPTISAITKQAIRQSGGIFDDIPVMACNTKEELYATLKTLFMNKHKLYDISVKTKTFTDTYHSYEAVGKMWKDIYLKL